jgi:hypothetical protein
MAGESCWVLLQRAVRVHAQIECAWPQVDASGERPLQLARVWRCVGLGERLAESMPRRNAMTDRQVRGVHAGYLRGEWTIREGAEAIGYSRATAQRRIHELGLEMRPPRERRPAGSRAQAEQQVITERLAERIDALRQAQELSVARLSLASRAEFGCSGYRGCPGEEQPACENRLSASNLWSATACPSPSPCPMPTDRSPARLWSCREAPQHREWRQARPKAAGEIEWLHSTLPA